MGRSALAKDGGPIANGLGLERLAVRFGGGELNGKVADGGALRVADGDGAVSYTHLTRVRPFISGG